MSDTTTATLVDLANQAEAAREAVSTLTGIDTISVRSDLGMVLGYASTAAYALEARGDGNGNVRFRVNLEWYPAATAIPTEYRKARTLALAFESEAATAAILQALEAEAAREAARTAQRNAEWDARNAAPSSAANVMRAAIERETPAVDPNATEAAPAEPESVEVFVCADCSQYITNDEPPVVMDGSSRDGDIDLDWAARVKANEPANRKLYALGSDTDDLDFSTLACDYCGTTLGGFRYNYARFSA